MIRLYVTILLACVVITEGTLFDISCKEGKPVDCHCNKIPMTIGTWLCANGKFPKCKCKDWDGNVVKKPKPYLISSCKNKKFPICKGACKDGSTPKIDAKMRKKMCKDGSDKKIAWNKCQCKDGTDIGYNNTLSKFKKFSSEEESYEWDSDEESDDKSEEDSDDKSDEESDEEPDDDSDEKTTKKPKTTTKKPKTKKKTTKKKPKTKKKTKS